MTVVMTDADREALAEARQNLEHPGLAARMTDLLGMPIDRGLKMLPEAVTDTIQDAVTKSLEKAFDVAVSTLQDPSDRKPRLWTHRLMAGVSGAAGGAFGLPALALELPISTVLILRSVADIARSHGEDLQTLPSRLACLEVFALGGGRKPTGENAEAESAELGYFAVRAGLAKHVTDAARHLAAARISDPTAPSLVRLLSVISKRFGVVVTEKVAAQAVPIIGAAGGALINTFFIDHYQTIARAHFTVRQLERTYGTDEVRRAYEQLPDQ